MDERIVWLIREELSKYEAEAACRRLGLTSALMPGGLYAVYTLEENRVKELGKRVDEICLELGSWYTSK